MSRACCLTNSEYSTLDRQCVDWRGDSYRLVDEGNVTAGTIENTIGDCQGCSAIRQTHLAQFAGYERILYPCRSHLKVVQ